MKMIDITGQRFGRLTALSPNGKKYNRFLWACRCDCERVVVVDGNSLRMGNTTSCGCLASELRSKNNFKHGRYGSPEYRSWSHMLSRCTNPKVERYPQYGGRGIAVCERWKDFRNFFADMGLKPGHNYSLNRINNDGDYEPSNCEWATMKDQQNNRSDNRVLALDGKSNTLAEWSRITGLEESTIRARIDKHGWSVGRSLTQPLRGSEL